MIDKKNFVDKHLDIDSYNKMLTKTDRKKNLIDVTDIKQPSVLELDDFELAFEFESLSKTLETYTESFGDLDVNERRDRFEETVVILATLKDRLEKVIEEMDRRVTEIKSTKTIN